MSEWRINPFPPHPTPVDWTGKSFTNNDLKIHDYYRVGRITVVVRSDDFIAYVEGNSSVWECGRTGSEAVGNLIMCNPSILLGPPYLRKVVSHLVDEASLYGSAGSYVEVSRVTVENLSRALEAK